jgi:2-polyprenyl-3-methyl-5-hydroxy-6-metoxy-1,4-benzoquinol methylase
MNVNIIADHFDRKAADYSKHYDNPLPQNLLDYEKHKRLQTMVHWVTEYANSKAWQPIRILDVGCGSGNCLLALLSMLPQATAVGIDLSSSMIASARKLLETAGVADRAQLLVGESNVIDQPFEVVISLGVIGYQHDQCQFARHLASHVAMGGIQILSYANGDSCLRRLKECATRIRRRGSVTFRPIRSNVLDSCLEQVGLIRRRSRNICCNIGLPRGPMSVHISRFAEKHILNPEYTKWIGSVGLSLHERMQ